MRMNNRIQQMNIPAETYKEVPVYDIDDVK